MRCKVRRNNLFTNALNHRKRRISLGMCALTVGRAIIHTQSRRRRIEKTIQDLQESLIFPLRLSVVACNYSHAEPQKTQRESDSGSPGIP